MLITYCNWRKIQPANHFYCTLLKDKQPCSWTMTWDFVFCLPLGSFVDFSFYLFIFFTGNTKCGFIVYQNSKFFRSKIFKPKSNFSQKIISGKTDETKKDQRTSVEIVFNPRVSFPTNNKKNSVQFWLQKQGWLGKRNLQKNPLFF